MREKDHNSMLVSHPDVSYKRIFRVDPNYSAFPLEATVRVFTDENDPHELLFSLGREGQRTRIFLDAAQPPLEMQTPSRHEYWVEDDRLIDDRAFILRSPLPTLAKTSFKVLWMEANILDLGAPTDIRERHTPGFISPTE